VNGHIMGAFDAKLSFSMWTLRPLRQVQCLMYFLTLADLQTMGGEATFLEVHYSPAMQPLVNVSVGGQVLKLVFDASSGDTTVFVREEHACMPAPMPSVADDACYSYGAALRRGTVKVCKDNQKAGCGSSEFSEYKCENVFTDLQDLSKVQAHIDELLIDGMVYTEVGVEAKDEVGIILCDGESCSTGPIRLWPNMPVRLLVEPMNVSAKEQLGPSLMTGGVGGNGLVLPKFVGTDGILGTSGPSLSCRNESVWGKLLQELEVTTIAIDLRPPPQALLGHRDVAANATSAIVLNHVDPRWTLTWSQAKQTGDVVNDGMHEFLMYHPKICGVDLLYNTSSNWLAVIDTSGACLSFPAFLFERLRAHVPISCPFAPGESAAGRLCSPVRASPSSKNARLPALYFQLEDVQDPEPPKLHLPLERLVFKNGSQELLCLARADDDSTRSDVDMRFANIGIGSLAVSALYTVVDLQSHSIGLAPRAADPLAESSENGCAATVECSSPMQTYYPPSNECEDPECSEYLLMSLDEQTKMCTWSSAVPISFALILVTLVVLDFVSHKLYKQAIEKASGYSQ